jgi:ribosomal protein S18 acetylase RimI-like enzyme
MSTFKSLTSDEWITLRDARLLALRDSPAAFLATYEREIRYSEEKWRSEFDRGAWNVGLADKRPVSLLGVTREPGSPLHERYLEYLWVAPEWRGTGLGRSMVELVLAQLMTDGVRTAFLWVLDGNAPARRLYERVGFVSTHVRQPISDVHRPGLVEERMHLNLQDRQADRSGPLASF